jgi:hypothetical protein
MKIMKEKILQLKAILIAKEDMNFGLTPLEIFLLVRTALSITRDNESKILLREYLLRNEMIDIETEFLCYFDGVESEWIGNNN